MPRATRTNTRDATRRQQREWVEGLAATTGRSFTALAQEAGLNPTTLTRFMNVSRYDGVLNATTVATLVDKWGAAPPGGIAAADAERGVDATPMRPDDAPAHADAIRALIAGRPDCSAWRVMSDVLELAGLRAGDVMLIDQAAEAQSGDVVCVQLELGVGAQTLFRVYDAPFAVAATHRPARIKPLLINGETVRIAGVMTEALRTRRAA